MGNARFLRVGYVEDAPNIFVERDENNQPVLKGYAIEVLKWLAADLNFTYELVEVDYTDGFAGLEKEFSYKSLHLGLPIYGLKEGRNRIMTSLTPFDFGYNTLIIPFPKRQNDPWSSIKPFSFTVWILILAALISLAFVFKLLTAWNVSKSAKAQTKTQPDEVTAIYLVGVLTNQGGYCSSKSRSSRFLAGLWCLAALVLVNAYSGSLITYMTAPKVTPIVNSIEDVSQRNGVQLLARKNDFIRDVIMAATGSLKPLGANLARVSPDTCGPSHDTIEFDLCIEKVKNGGYTMASDTDIAHIVVHREFKRTGICTLTEIEHPYFPSYGGFVVPLNTTQGLRNALDISILKAFSYGLTDKWRRDNYPAKNNQCINFRIQPNTAKRLSLMDMKSPFLVLGMGFGLSLVVFLYELMRKKFALSK